MSPSLFFNCSSKEPVAVYTHLGKKWFKKSDITMAYKSPVDMTRYEYCIHIGVGLGNKGVDLFFVTEKTLRFLQRILEADGEFE